LLCPNNNIIEIFNNKIKFNEFMEENYKDNIPPTVIYKNIYPYLAKHKYGVGGCNIFIINNEYDIIKNNINDDYLLQKYINTDNLIMGQFLCINGKVLLKFFYKICVTENFFISRGKLKNYEKIEFNCNEVFIDLFKKLNYTGFACVDFTFHKNKVIIYEINPRVGGTFINDTDDFNIFLSELLKM
jgi:glutathione synthase/RimK-type ligase-like ATP-grasp enzyme